MGPIQDRTVEELGVSDRAVTANRRMLLRAIEDHEAGLPTPGRATDDASARALTGPLAFDTIARADAWQEGWRDGRGETPRAFAVGRERGSCRGLSRCSTCSAPGRAARPASSSATGCGTTSDTRRRRRRQRVIDERGIELVRLSFPDQHGLLRGKTLTREAFFSALRGGTTAPSTLVVKDTACTTIYSVFEGRRLDRDRADGGRRRPAARPRPDDLPRAAVGAADGVGAVRHPLPRRPSGAVLDPPPARRPGRRPRRARLRAGRRARGRVPRLQSVATRRSATATSASPARRPRSRRSAAATSCCWRTRSTRSTTSCRRCATGSSASACRCCRSSTSSGRRSWS